MSDSTNTTSNYDMALLIGRVAMTPLFLISAYYKITQWPGIVGMLTAQGAPLPLYGGYIAIFAETVFPLLLLIGLWTRAACIGLILYTLGTCFIGHRFWEFTGPAQVGQVLSFFKNIALCGGFLILAFTGPGRLAVSPKP